MIASCSLRRVSRRLACEAPGLAHTRVQAPLRLGRSRHHAMAKRSREDDKSKASDAPGGSDGEPLLRSELPEKIQGFVTTGHWLTVPLDHFSENGGDGATIQVFAREVVATSKVLASQPFLCYFQGGPGFESPAPAESTQWLAAATKHFRVILLDQRGTGHSTPIRHSTLSAKGNTAAQVAYLRHFRADSIVADAELLRRQLSSSSGDGRRWCVLGQSFGGFCCTRYLSAEPQGLLEVFMTGGIPPHVDDDCAADKVYMATFRRVMVQNEKFYTRFPRDVQLVKDIVNFLASQPEGGVQTPCGNWLRPRTLQLLGLSALGGGGPGGGFDRLHFMLAGAMDYSGPEPELTPAFLKDFDNCMPWDTNPLYAVLHETCYTQGPATRWAAQRVREQAYFKVFDAEAAAASTAAPVFFTGEMVFPWMFDDIAALRPLKKVAEAVANAEDWSRLYDSAKLQQNRVPVAAATYCEGEARVQDMYVDFNLAQETAAKIAGCRQWMSNEFQHSGLRDDGATIFEALLAMTRGSRVLF